MARPALTDAQRAEGVRLAARLRAERLALERDQADVARRSGVSVDAIRALEGNRTATPSFVLVARLARELALDLDELADTALEAPTSSRDLDDG